MRATRAGIGLLSQGSEILHDSPKPLVRKSLAALVFADPAAVDSEGRREAALSRLLPLRISLSGLQARSRRVSVLLDEILDSERCALQGYHFWP